MEVNELKLTRDYFLDLFHHTEKNESIASLYDLLYEDTGNETFLEHAHSMRLCVKYWDTDYYRIQQVKDIKRVNLCRDKFCSNCQSMLAIKRQGKFTPMLDQLYDRYQIYHAVFTVSNVYGEELLPTLDRMYLKFRHLIRFLACDKQIRGTDFHQYGYVGALRALEVTMNQEERTFHPHFHVLLLLKKGLNFKRRYVNSFSFDSHGRSTTKFTSFEILLQKIWYLLMNGIMVTKEHIEELKEGYSVVVNTIAKGEYHEVFKYACKGAFKDDTIYDIDDFRCLYFALKNRRMIQGYGVLHNFQDDSSKILENELEETYLQVITRLRSFEDPYFTVQSLDEVLDDKDISYISKSSLKRLLIERKREEAALCPAK